MERTCRTLGALLLVAALSACETNSAEVAQDWQIERLATKDYWWMQDFSQNADDWRVLFPYYSGSVVHNADSETATLSFFGGADGYFQQFTSSFGKESITESATWLGDHISEIDIFLDTDWPLSMEVSYNVVGYYDGWAVLNNSFIVYVPWSADDAALIVRAIVGGSSSSYEVHESGWYTFQHVFRDSDGLLVVDFNLLDASGLLLWSDSYESSYAIGPEGKVGSAHNAIVGTQRPAAEDIDIEINNQALYQVIPGPQSMDDCKRGGFQDFGFSNQGQCIASVQANDNATPHN